MLHGKHSTARELSICLSRGFDVRCLGRLFPFKDDKRINNLVYNIVLTLVIVIFLPSDETEK